MTSLIVCRTRLLTAAQSKRALRRGLEINPANALEHGFADIAESRRGGQRRLALLIGRRWPETGVQLSVQFLDNPSNALRKRVLLHMNAWSESANVRFEETREIGVVRIARVDHPSSDAGYWSYVGTEILGIDEDQQTMNLEGFTMKTPDSEFHRVVRHETGHTLGFEHEHMRSDLVARIDRRKAVAYFRNSDGWSEAETHAQVLTPLKNRSLMGTTESDPLSIMCYQLPAEIMNDGKAIPGGTDINAKDRAFAAQVYPKDGKPKKIAPLVAPAVMALPPMPFVAATAPADEPLQIVIIDAFDATTGQPVTAGRPHFARVFASYDGARVMEAMQIRKDGGVPTRFGRIIDIHERIKNYTNRDRGHLPDDTEMLEFGTDLFETLFHGEVRRLYDEARARQQGRKLDVVLTSMISWIAEKPWEFAYDRTRRSFLATEDVHFIRNALAAIPAERIAPRAGPLRILVVSAQPVGFGRLSIAQEEEMIRRGFDALVAAGLATIDTLPRATPSELQQRVSTSSYDIVHFIGHGSYDEESGVGSLIFESGSGGSVALPERSVREIFCGRGIKLVFLNACQSGSGGRADFNKGVAQSLVSHGVPALVANQYSVLDTSATSFAQHFYWALSQGMGIGPAAREARIAVNCALDGESIDWALPVVYARDPTQALCAPPARPTPASTAGERVRRETRRASVIRVAVWDIDSAFPGLDALLERMNGAQAGLEFERITRSSPLGIWDVDRKATDGTPYLVAEKLAERMERVPAEIGVEILACITRHWMRDATTLNIYGWWPAERKPPVVVASLAGFDDLLAEGPATKRALVNMLVSAVAGFISGLDTHERGRKDCPMWSNTERSMDHLTDVQRFDPKCRSHLQRLHPRELEALESLLEEFNKQ